MKIDLQRFIRIGKKLSQASGGRFGPCSGAMRTWCIERKLPKRLCKLFETFAPLSEVWAGPGTLFGEEQVIKWNNDFPEGISAGLLIVGSASNGDHIAVDLKTGSTGYINHEEDWTKYPRGFFVAVSPSVGSYLEEINMSDVPIPKDYFEAIEYLNSTRQP